MKATIVFDGACGVCNACVQFVIPRDPNGYFSFVSAQSVRGQAIREVAGNPPADSILLIEEDAVYVRSEAVLRIGRRLTGPWRWVWWLRWIPRSLRDGLYDEFARYRYRFGTTTTCELLTSEQRNHILTDSNR